MGFYFFFTAQDDFASSKKVKLFLLTETLQKMTADRQCYFSDFYLNQSSINERMND